MTANNSRPNRSKTPASMPDAIDTGMRFIARSNQPEKPTMVDHQRGNQKSAGGLSQRDTCRAGYQHGRTGRGPRRNHRHAIAQKTMRMQVRPIPRPSAHIHEAISAVPAPTAWAA
jgi:hypothetical protein